jgi:UDP-N-acetylmuramate--alanine ligase
LASSFSSSFADAERVVITDIYTAGEPNPHGLTGQVIVDALVGTHAAASYVGSFDEIRSFVSENAPHYDAIFFLGAGDVASVIESLGVTP